MRWKLGLAAFLSPSMLVAVALAQTPPSDTVKAVVAKGATFASQGRSYDFIAKGDGAYSDKAGKQVGTYRVDGRQLCMTPTTFGRELCFTFPDGKKSGDTFMADSESGGASVTIG
ncbi:MAG TPA: hypothetical protein VG942_01695 [Hyphomonadaceae bacterium]|nr:hypothetical protein [Hyphomonadaceae bacterium]